MPDHDCTCDACTGAPRPVPAPDVETRLHGTVGVYPIGAPADDAPLFEVSITRDIDGVVSVDVYNADNHTPLRITVDGVTVHTIAPTTADNSPR